jgi:membrane-associated phospholipid phosphatase
LPPLPLLLFSPHLFTPAALPFVALIITIVIVEFGVMHTKQSMTTSVQAAIHIFFMAIVGFAVVLAVTEATKPIASRFRPDFLSRCKGANPVLGAADVGKRLDIYKDCLNNNKEEIEDGRKSFPSGHSSNTLSTCW